VNIKMCKGHIYACLPVNKQLSFSDIVFWETFLLVNVGILMYNLRLNSKT